MKTIGILGGFGPEATTTLEDAIHREARKLVTPRFNQGYPPVVTVHLRHPPVLLDDQDRAIQPLTIDPRVLDAARRLGAWADVLLIAANTPHLFIEEIEGAAGVEVLSMVDVVVDEIRARGVDTVGLLGLGVPEAYVRRFTRVNISYLAAPDDVQAALDEGIFRTLELSTTDAHREAARRAVDALRQAGAPAIVLGCTEIPLLLGAASRAADLVDPGALLARAAVAYAVGADDRSR